LRRVLLFVVCADAFLAPSRTTRRRPLRASDDAEEVPLMVAVAEIPRPLGLILEEREDGRGVEIIRVDPRGNAALSRADVLVGDRVLMVGDAACGESGFDEVAGLIGSSPDVVELTLGRALDVVRVEWPNGCVVGARPGDRMVDLAAKAGWGVRYSCTGGSCGTCREPRPTPSFRAETRVDPRRRAPAADGDGRALLAPLRRARPEERARRRRRPRRPVLKARTRPSSPSSAATDMKS
jgi:hypothetical protein